MRPSIIPLSEMPPGTTVLPGMPDVRGWRVRTRAGSDIGEVSELFVDARSRRLRYLSVRLHAVYVDDVHHRVLVPIGVARLDQSRDDVCVDAGAGSLLAAPVFRPERLDRAYERALLGCFGWRDPAPDDAWTADHFYRGPFFDERPFLAPRRAALLRRTSHADAMRADGDQAELR